MRKWGRENAAWLLGPLAATIAVRSIPIALYLAAPLCYVWGVISFFVLAAWWLLLAGAAAYVGAFAIVYRLRDHYRASAASAFVAGSLLALAVLTGSMRVPLDPFVLVSLSAPQLESLADVVRQVPTEDETSLGDWQPTRRRAGLARVCATTRLGDTVLIALDCCGWWFCSYCGIAHANGGLAELPPHWHTRHVFGPWWSFGTRD